MNSNKDKFSVLVVDDDPSYRSVLQTIYVRANFLVTTAENGKAAVRLMEKDHYDLVVSDLQMPEIDGASLYRFMQQYYPQTCVILMGADLKDERYASLMETKGVHWLSKPFRRAEVLKLSQELLENVRKEQHATDEFQEPLKEKSQTTATLSSHLRN